MSSLESAVVASESDTLGHYINGQIVSDQRRSAAVFNPATGQVTQQLALADQATVTTAVDAAAAAFPTWRQIPPNKRAQILFRYKQLLEQNAEAICQLITAEHGKVIDDARGELGRGIEVVDYACGISELLKGEFSKNAGPDIDSWSEFQPLGVVAGITPFNFPAMVPMWMFPMAIACGNTFILKPSERDPSPALLLAKLFREAGLPDGVFNVVNGDAETVQHILDDDRVQALS
ncbi:MAG: methylmalonate-semialdehyde dehydrogenase (CoA acylating), partial [Gammaproteobacteria bacterium]|nr:methylmalonate-semialdehyde dehydrogenase (CoA acylating) [Gammaproteobacteria bacterium]